MHVDHVGLCPADLERALRFYRDGLGLEVLFDRTLAADLQALLGVVTAQVRTVFLGDPAQRGSGVLELLDLGEGPPADGAPVPGLPHRGLFLLSFVVDVDATLARLAGLGLGGVPRRMPMPGGRQAVTVVDPDGVVVELLGQPVSL